MVRRIGGSAVASVFAVVAAVLCVACGSKAPPPAADVYTVRGVVEKLPQASGPERDLYVHHAPIPDFRDERGAVVGMMSMTMPFPLSSEVPLAGIAPGDAVEFTFTVRWKPRSGYEITRIRKLPAGTVIDFGGRR
jgi:Cu/Ag efflux protein CusF